jgi:predicted nucleotidyltransferase component of viral defense system
LLTQVEAETGIDAALVEKDYWINHSLWALHETKLAIWFKGGTSLSKGFGPRVGRRAAQVTSPGVRRPSGRLNA